MEITAAVVREKERPFGVEELELEEPREGEVLVRVVAAGMCHTDLICRDQWYPVPLPSVLGHEGAGVVERVGEGVTKVSPGDRVVLTYASCGRCTSCQRGKPSYCKNFFDLNFGGARLDKTNAIGGGVHGHFFGQSSFATYALATERNVVKVDADVPLEILGPLGCGIQTGAGGVLNSLHPEAGTSIAVFGTGAVGLSAVMAARVAGCATIVGVDVRPERLELARELGATHIVDANEANPVEEIRRITGGGADYAIETTAVPAVFRQAVDALGTLGVCGLIGAARLGTEVSLDMNDLLLPGKTVRGIVEGDSVPDVFIPRLIELYAQERFPFDRLIEFYELDEINRAAEDAEGGSVIKPVIRMPN
ncbi:NAD(P)-dependent alcohol dehydrogenase [Rubrobacter calidifluminis]|uniref:NAD(P)-dependent alcohol dehydrogenase n=1 Tax=Rubrobacter calidifluminis TaxID=1392640 RepID=UPI00235E6D12|nr:NAD(P)-dependent alcohol dehydrogenase [Rubrobacter calidifluminis]